jgi:hypothetical protein
MYFAVSACACVVVLKKVYTHSRAGDTVTDEAMDIAFGNLQKSLNAGNDAYTLRVANRVYSHNKMTVKSAAMDKLKKHYDTDLRLVDFATKADQIKVRAHMQPACEDARTHSVKSTHGWRSRQTTVSKNSFRTMYSTR